MAAGILDFLGKYSAGESGYKLIYMYSQARDNLVMRTQNMGVHNSLNMPTGLHYSVLVFFHDLPRTCTCTSLPKKQVFI